MSTRTVKIGLVGCGVIGRLHAKAMAGADHIELAAVADLSPDAARELAAAHGVARVYEDGEQLLNDDAIEAVVLAMPTGVRTAMALKAFAAGKHVLLEKPVAMNVEEVEALIANRGDRVAAACSARFGFLDSARIGREVVETGALGALRVVRVRGLRAVGPKPEKAPPPWRLSRRLNGGGIMANWGCYDLNYMMEVTGWQLKPETVFAQTFAPAPHLWPGRAAADSDAEAHVVAMIRCAGGAVLTMERGEFLTIDNETAWQVTGECGSLRLKMVPTRDGQPTVVRDDTDPEHGLSSHTILEEPGEDVTHTMPVSDFASAILEGRGPMMTLEKSRVIQQITDAIYQSAETGEAVDVNGG